jgi:hypothetical protein
VDVYAVQNLTALRDITSIILFIPVVFNRIFHSSYNVWVTATAVKLIAFVDIKALYTFTAVVIGCFFKDNVFIHDIAILLKCK